MKSRHIGIGLLELIPLRVGGSGPCGSTTVRGLSIVHQRESKQHVIFELPTLRGENLGGPRPLKMLMNAKFNLFEAKSGLSLR
jgi:hypothetical protein